MKYFLYFVIIIFSVSCSTTKTVTDQSSQQNASITKSDFFKKINSTSDFDQIKINSKITIENGSFIPTLDTTIYIEDGTKTWINITALLINVARGVATPEGIKGYEKWNKTYIDSDFAYLNDLLKVNFINYNALQHLLLGQTFIPINETDFNFIQNAEGFILTSKKAQIINTNGKTTQYNTTLQYDTHANLNQIVVEEQGQKNRLEVNYFNWTQQQNLTLPKNVKIIIKSDKTTTITLENTTFAFDTMQTPYSVPANYKKTVIQ